MKVYRFCNDVEHYQYLLAERPEDEDKLRTQCARLKATWTPPPVVIHQPLLNAGALYNFHCDTPIFTDRAANLLRTHLEMAGELLELPFNGQSYWMLNVLECINCLDAKKTQWRESGGERLSPEQYVFHRNRFSESNIFKIPETYRSEVLVVDREDDEGFVDELIEYQLEGYTLQLLWTDS
jgi:hypothetical protein